MASNRRPLDDLRETVGRLGDQLPRPGLRSVDDLQLLVAFFNSSGRWWDTASVGRELRLGQDEARKVLERFAASNLLEIRLTDDVRYQFRPGTDALHQGVAACVAEFGANPAALVRAIVEGAGRDDPAR